jgi:hypothetical protein
LVPLQEFEKAALRLVLGNKCIQVRCVTLMDVSSAAEKLQRHGREPPPAPAPAASGGKKATNNLRFKVATKTYFLHYRSLEESRVGYDQQQHYATLPYEALYEGYFTSALAARAYLSLYGALSFDKDDEEEEEKPRRMQQAAAAAAAPGDKKESKGWGLGLVSKFMASKEDVDPSGGAKATQSKAQAMKDPYSRVNLEANMSSLKRQVERSLHDKNSLEAFRQTLMLVLLSDDLVTKPAALLDPVSLSSPRLSTGHSSPLLPSDTFLLFSSSSPLRHASAPWRR